MTNVKYIYQLPYKERQVLCKVLDDNKSWIELGREQMKYDDFTIKNLQRECSNGNSPSDKLLTMWSNHNHTIFELFILLYRLKQFKAMEIIKSYVEPDYHQLLQDNNANACEVLVVVDDNISKENNESLKPINLLRPRSPLPLNKILGCPQLTSSAITYVAESAGAIPQIPYEELQASTENWSKSSILGKGGFGTVFKGVWKFTNVAIKRIESKENNEESHSEQIKQSIAELHCLNSYRHDNILPLYGYSIGGPQPCLVYQFMSGGSLDLRLRAKDVNKILDWKTRLDIAIGTARGLQYLHTIGDKPLIHGDIKPANVLLDSSNTPRIGDFGLAREGPLKNLTHVTVNRIQGTRPYLPDEFLRSHKFSTKVDTYSFGVVLFELSTSQYAYSDKREKNKFLKDHVVNYEGDILELKDPRAQEGERIFRRLLEIGIRCVCKRPKDRPEMVDVLLFLEEVLRIES